MAKEMREHLVLDIRHGRYECIGKELVITHRHDEPPESWFDATTVAVAKGNDISLTEAFKTAHPRADRVDRVEVIDHRECVWCRGRLTANYLQKDGSYKELPCDKCDGSGIMGGRVYTAHNAKVELSYQDDDKTLKVFVRDR